MNDAPRDPRLGGYSSPADLTRAIEQSRQLNKTLAERLAMVMRLHQLGADRNCRDCGKPYPCPTWRLLSPQ